MAIDKSLYSAPEGIEALAVEEAPIEIEIEDPEAVRINICLLYTSPSPRD